MRDALNLGKEDKIDTAKLSSVTELDLSYNGPSTTTDYCILSLDGLKFFPSLNTLVIDGNDVKSLEPVAKCASLISFSAQGCSLDNAKAEPLKRLSGLVYLNIKENSLTDLSLLSYLPKLQILNVGQNELASDKIFAEASLPELKRLYVNASGLTSIENISRLRTLEYLDISGLSLYDKDIACLQNLTNLQTLVCRSNTVREGTVFNSLPNLKVLDLYNNEIYDLTNLAGCEKLEELDVSANVLYKLNGIEKLTALGFDKLPVCIAKTQYSFSDDPSKLGAPSGFKVTVRNVKISAGAGFVVVLSGVILTMPGLPKSPAAERIDVDENDKIIGLF